MFQHKLCHHSMLSDPHCIVLYLLSLQFIFLYPLLFPLSTISTVYFLVPTVISIIYYLYSLFSCTHCYFHYLLSLQFIFLYPLLFPLSTISTVYFLVPTVISIIYYLYSLFSCTHCYFHYLLSLQSIFLEIVDNGNNSGYKKIDCRDSR